MEVSKKDAEQQTKEFLEDMIEGAVSEDFLKKVSLFITRDNYEDIVEERFISKLCGYPLCDSILTKIPKHKYQIKRDGVYDIEERKRFCSDNCFKCSKHLYSQISEVPIWLRTSRDQLTTIKLLPLHNKIFYPGSLIIDKKIISAKDTEKELEEKSPALEQSDIAKLAMDLESATLKERPSTKNIQKKVESKDAKKKIQSLVKELEELKLIKGKVEEHSIQEASKLTDKHLSASKENGAINKLEDSKASHADALTSISTSSTFDQKSELYPENYSLSAEPPPEPEYTTLQMVEIRLRQWFTLLTLEYVMGGEKFYAMCKQYDVTTEMLFPASHYDPDKIAALRKNYYHLCYALEKQDEEEEMEDKTLLHDVDSIDNTTFKEKEMDNKTLLQKHVDLSDRSTSKDKNSLAEIDGSNPNNLPDKKASLGKPKKIKNKKNKKKVTFVEQSKNEDEEVNDEPLLDRPLPYVDFASQKDIRTDIVYKKVNGFLSKHFDASTGFYPFHISSDLVRIIRTFRLTADNIYCKPAVWLILTFCLLKLVSLKYGAEHPSKHMLEEPRVVKHINDQLRHFNTNLHELYDLLDKVLIALLPYSVSS